MPKIKLTVNGRPVPLNPFVQKFITRAVLGMVGSLDGVPARPKSVSLTVKPQ